MWTKLIVLIFASVLVAATSANSGEFDGWCIPGDGCTGDEKIENDSFSTCEETCKMTNPTQVRGMDALLYDIVCAGDGSSATSTRTLFMRYKDAQEAERAIAANSDGVTELRRCE